MIPPYGMLPPSRYKRLLSQKGFAHRLGRLSHSSPLIRPIARSLFSGDCPSEPDDPAVPEGRTEQLIPTDHTKRSRHRVVRRNQNHFCRHPVSSSVLSPARMARKLLLSAIDKPKPQPTLFHGRSGIPFLALTIGPLFANRLEPRIFGLPFLLAYLVFWVLATPVFMLVDSWVRRPR